MIIVYKNFSKTPKLLAGLVNDIRTRMLESLVRPHIGKCVASKYGEGRAALQLETGRRSEDLVINWGVKIPDEIKSRFGTCLNLHAGKDKRQQMSELYTAGVTIPRTLGINAVEGSLPVLVRKHIQSHGGNGVRVITHQELGEWGQDTDHIYQDYIEKRAEFRVHVFKGKAICVTRKYMRENMTHDTEIWNFERGWAQKTVTKIGELLDESLSLVAVNAVGALGYDFGAVDIAMSMTGTLHVLEVNSAPSLIDERAKLWINAIWGQEVYQIQEEDDAESED